MGLTRVMMGFLALFFTAGSIVMIILTFLGGASGTHPLNVIFFIEANTANIPGAPDRTRWTFWNACRVGLDGKSHCGQNYPAYPFDPPSDRTFNTTVNIPPDFIGTNHYFLTSRFMFPFCIITIFFAVMAFFVGLVSLCSRISALTAAILAWLALIFQTITTCLMTAIYVQARNAWKTHGHASSLGQKAFGLMWASMPTLFLGSLLFLIAGLANGKRNEGYTGREHRRRGFFPSRTSGQETTERSAE